MPVPNQLSTLSLTQSFQFAQYFFATVHFLVHVCLYFYVSSFLILIFIVVSFIITIVCGLS